MSTVFLEEAIDFDVSRSVDMKKINFSPTAAQAMEHPYLAAYHDATDEPVAESTMLDEEPDR